MISIQSLLGSDTSERVDSGAPQGKRAREDFYNPRPAQEKLLARVREDAEADAIRHAEDMANRIFPVVEEAESTATQRIAALGAAYAATRGRLDAQIESCRIQVELAKEQLRATEAALAEAGVAAERLGLAPLGDRMATWWQAGIAAAVAAVCGALLGRLDLSPLALGLLGVAGLGLIAGALTLQIRHPESPTVTALRRNHRREKGELQELQGSFEHDRERAKGLAKETLRLVEAETAFAREMVASYESAAFSALPVGSLAEGERAIRKQREPDVATPGWVVELVESEA